MANGHIVDILFSLKFTRIVKYIHLLCKYKIVFLNYIWHLYLDSFSSWQTAPIGKPVTTIAHNTSATSIYISWKPPPPDTILGEFLGYRITYKVRDRNADPVEIYIRDSSVEVDIFQISFYLFLLFCNILIWPAGFFAWQSHEIHDLETYTQYLVSLQVFNPEGPGPATTVLVMTDEGGEWNRKLKIYFVYCSVNAVHTFI